MTTIAMRKYGNVWRAALRQRVPARRKTRAPGLGPALSQAGKYARMFRERRAQIMAHRLRPRVMPGTAITSYGVYTQGALGDLFDSGVGGFFSSISKALKKVGKVVKKVVTSKVFKVAAIGASLYFGGPLIMAGLRVAAPALKSAIGGLAKKLLTSAKSAGKTTVLGQVVSALPGSVAAQYPDGVPPFNPYAGQPYALPGGSPYYGAPVTSADSYGGGGSRGGGGGGFALPPDYPGSDDRTPAAAGGFLSMQGLLPAAAAVAAVLIFGRAARGRR
jgi:hypothetical protein